MAKPKTPHHNATLIYHNPRCRKSRETLEILREHGIEPEIIEYLKVPPTAKELRRVLSLLKLDPSAIIRRKEFKELGIDQPKAAGELIEIMVANPQVIERPIVVHGERACLGRPPENVLELLDE